MHRIDFTDRERSSGIDLKKLAETATNIRISILEELGGSRSGHPGGSLSCTDLLVAAYFAKLRHDPANPRWLDRDRLLLSKGHAAPALYAVLAECGYFPKEELGTLRRLGSRLQGHPDPVRLPGVEIPGGPEGIGLSEGVGMALGAKMDKKPIKTYVIMGDGELDEGEVWEAAMSAAKYRLDNLIAIVDLNGLQQEGTTAEIMPTNPRGMFKSIGWDVRTINGHSIPEIISALDWADSADGKPKAIIAKTRKGEGVGFMENVVKYHSEVPDKAGIEKAISEVRRNGGNS